MTLDLFSGLNVGIGVAFAMLACMCWLHLARGYRFSVKQERFVLLMTAITFICLGVNLASSGVLGSILGSSHLSGQLMALAIIPLVAKVLGGVGLWWIIAWVLIRFYPSQQKS